MAMANIRIKWFRCVKPVINFATSVMGPLTKVAYNVIQNIIENFKMENVSVCQATITMVKIRYVSRRL